MITTGPLFTETHTLRQADFDLFAGISGDNNPIHVDPAFSARTRFGHTVSHGMLLKQELSFAAVVPREEEVTATVSITRLRPDKHLCDLATTLTSADGRVLATGRALVLIKDVARPAEA